MNPIRCGLILSALAACASSTAPGTGGTPAAVPVATVTVTPSAPALVAGDSVQLTATLKDAGGATLTGRPVTWTSSAPAVASVSGTGMVKALVAGAVTITATSEGKVGTASLAVSALVSSNTECASPGAGWIWCDDFETNRLASYFEYDSANGNFTRAAGSGFNGSFGMRTHFNTGSVGVGYLHLAVGKTPAPYIRPVDAGTANYRELYYRMYLRQQPGFTGGGSKLSRAFVFAAPSWAQAMIAHLWAGNPPNADYLYIDPASGTDTAGALQTTAYNDFAHFRFLGARKGTTPLFSTANAGTWYCVEAHVKLNTAGQANGVHEFWVNDNLEVSRGDLNFLGSFSAYGLNAVYFENYWNAGSPAVQERYFDRIVVSTQRIGC